MTAAIRKFNRTEEDTRQAFCAGFVASLIVAGPVIALASMALLYWRIG